MTAALVAPPLQRPGAPRATAAVLLGVRGIQVVALAMRVVVVVVRLRSSVARRCSPWPLVVVVPVAPPRPTTVREAKAVEAQVLQEAQQPTVVARPADLLSEPKVPAVVPPVQPVPQFLEVLLLMQRAAQVEPIPPAHTSTVAVAVAVVMPAVAVAAVVRTQAPAVAVAVRAIPVALGYLVVPRQLVPARPLKATDRQLSNGHPVLSSLAARLPLESPTLLLRP
jgi:hypothetical protein